MSELSLELNSVSKTYLRGKQNQLTVLSDLNLDLRKGEVLALVAPSGAGKSTLLHIAGLLDVPDTGDVVLSGRNLANASDLARTKARGQEIGFVYQFHHLLPEFSAEENIVLPQLAQGSSARFARRRAQELLDQVGLSARAHHRPSALSGGEQQRVAFCRALANSPEVLLADEPTGNLDPETAEQVFAVLMDLARSTGLSAIVATHNLELAARMDRVCKLEGGKVIPQN